MGGSLQTGKNKLHILSSSTLDPLIYSELDNNPLHKNGSLTSADTLSQEYRTYITNRNVLLRSKYNKIYKAVC